MKKLLIVFILNLILTSFCLAETNTQNQIDCKPDCKQKLENCSKCPIEDDEYCVYNQCFLDKQYIKMKKALCLSRQQEARIDILYKNFKADMENQCCKYKNEKNKLLEMIECENECWKEQRKIVKEIQKETKQKAKYFKESIKEELCKNQYSDFRKFQRHQKRKIKKIVKYGKIIKLPCIDCKNCTN